MWFTRVSIHNPVFATMVMVAIVILGVFSYKKLQIQQFPDTNMPAMVITTNYPNASPKAVEQDVTNKIEDALNTIGGIDSLKSKSYQGKSVVIVKFDLGTDANADAEKVREQMATVQAEFNENVEAPQIKQVDPDAQPVISISVNSKDRSLRDISSLVENTIIKRLQDVNGVGEANTAGERVRQVNININPQKLNYYHVDVNEIVNGLKNDNQDFPAGSISNATTELNIQLKNSFKRVPDFEKIVIARRGDQVIHLGEVAQVEDGMADAINAAFINGKSAVTIDIIKTDDANTVDVAAKIKERVMQLQQELPDDIRIQVIKDNAKGIINSVNNVKETIFEGALLTILVVFLFLSSWRSTVITSLTLPIAVIGTFMAIYALGFSLNNLTLMALSLSIGILIDDAIVVRENISRHILLGKSHYQAALDGTKEIGLAVLATTSTLVAVFLPVSYMEGTIGMMFFEFGITVSVSVLLSLFISYTLDPMLSSLWYDPHLKVDKQPHWLRCITDWREEKLDKFTVFYEGILLWCLQHRVKTLAATSVVFAASFLLLSFIGKEFIPNADLGEVSVLATAPDGASLSYTSNKVIQIQKILEKIPDVDYSYAVINSSTSVGNNNATISIELKDKKDRQYNGKQIMQIIREKLSNMAGMTIMVGNTDSNGRVQRGIQVSIRGDSLQKLDELSQQVQAVMKKTPGIVDIYSTMNPDKPVIDLEIRRDIASDLGVTPVAIYNVLQPLFSTKLVGTWLGPDDNNYDVVVQLSENDRVLLKNLKDIYVPSVNLNASGNPIMVPLSQLVDIQTHTMPSQINHSDLLREVSVSANAHGISEGDASIALFKQLNQMKLPRGYSFSADGNVKKMAESAGYAASALGLAVIFIYIILASQFASFTQPIVIMASLPLSLIGVFIALFITGSTFNMFSVIGCIMLMGLVTKNAILLVDFANMAVRSGVERTQALIDAGKIRMRPILMTTLAMIFGMIPLALGIGEGAEQRMSMAQAIIGGIITSTILTLVIIPVVYTYIDDWSVKIQKRLFRANEGDSGV